MNTLETLLQNALDGAKANLQWLRSRKMVPYFTQFSQVSYVEESSCIRMIAECSDFLGSFSVQEINDFLLLELLSLQQSSPCRGYVNESEWYVICMRDVIGGSIEYSYVSGADYWNPQDILLPTESELLEECMWETESGPFIPLEKEVSMFMQQKIHNALHSLWRYRNLVRKNFVLLEEAISSPEGAAICKSLQDQVQVSIRNIQDEIKRCNQKDSPYFVRDKLRKKLVQAEDMKDSLFNKIPWDSR